ncbi:helix-turn-helix domain-containing protein [Romboutsia sp. 1001216sp1]|uniref:winged helix-turn-helix transcriptional regulator n=1 Tax=unclassified Romboutsia TaxID=2626894 RepID=UPI0018AAF3C9|nr:MULTISPECIES: helix-turn-helix domain-containing protein [unclassified Romboutsia]MDB8793992.1 helix-turn-helix domain-containing protein [Romboutsia sp. 1001216sp1]MDB8796919.1 helix-turn-helix domain-containing protein [Romboutsia sp. 1001216sp1]MDB8800133.1 helix-turn-helix domain-containing protein [Romboutsia sp. 1001216sp1]MDB8805770.1 helix-turn-helix domain-containing protein [Romboutsia sp. 1001216sp1]MDB8808254.1 helix-turn-helix domain-containing protein [Romboutsia sp. 1001216sp
MVYYNGKEFVCLLDFAMEFIKGKWKSILLCNLYRGPKRFLELQKSIGSLSQKVLNEKLKELENDGLIEKIVYAEVPPKVEYFLTDKGKELYEIISPLENWSNKYYPNLDKIHK